MPESAQQALNLFRERFGDAEAGHPRDDRIGFFGRGEAITALLVTKGSKAAARPALNSLNRIPSF